MKNMGYGVRRDSVKEALFELSSEGRIRVALDAKGSSWSICFEAEG